MGPSVASLRTPGTDLSVQAGPGLRGQWGTPPHPSLPARCLIHIIWNQKSQIASTQTQRFINGVTGVADGEIMCQERFRSSVMFTFIPGGLLCCFWTDSIRLLLSRRCIWSSSGFLHWLTGLHWTIFHLCILSSWTACKYATYMVRASGNCLGCDGSRPDCLHWAYFQPSGE